MSKDTLCPLKSLILIPPRIIIHPTAPCRIHVDISTIRPFFLFRYPFHTLTSFSCRPRNYDHGSGLDASHFGNECCTYSPSLCIQLQYKAVKDL